MGFVEEARAARAAAEGARAAYRGRVARAERSFLEARETRAESERSLEDALGSALLIARFKSLRLYPDRIECKGEAIRLGEVLGIDAEMEGSILQKVSVDPNSWSKSIRTIDKRTAVVTVRTPEWEYSVRTGPGQEASARRFVEAARDVLAPIPEGTGSGGTRGSRGCRGPSRGRTPRGRRRPRPGPPSRPPGRTRGRSGTPRLRSRRSWRRPRRTTSPCSPRPTGKGPGALRPGRPPHARPRAPRRAFGARALRRPLRRHFRPRRVPLHGRPPAQHGGGRRAGRVTRGAGTTAADRMDAKGHRPMRRRRGVRGGGEGGEGGRRGGAGRLPGPRRGRSGRSWRPGRRGPKASARSKTRWGAPC